MKVWSSGCSAGAGLPARPVASGREAVGIGNVGETGAPTIASAALDSPSEGMPSSLGMPIAA